MAKVSIDEFIVELSLQETVLKGLAKLEKQIVPFANRIEKSLNKAFNVNGSAKMSKTFTRIVKDADSAARKINRSLTSAFDIKRVGGSSLRNYEKDANVMARRISREIKKAYDVRGIRLPPIPRGRNNNSGGRSGNNGRRDSDSGSRGMSRRERINENIEQHFANNSRNGMTNSMTNLGMHTQRDAMIAELRRTADRFKADPNAKYSDYLRASRDVIFSYKQQVAEQRRANRETQRAAFMQHSLQDSTMNLVKGFASIYTALEFFKKALDEGARRTQAHTMAVVAYGDERTASDMTMKADDIANKYGMGVLDTRESMAKMRMTLPESMSNDDISSFFENESVFAHIAGMSKDDVGRLNYVIPQIAASSHLMGQDFMQLSGASPALIKRLEKLTNTSNVSDLKGYANKISGSDFVKLIMQALEVTPEQKKMAQDNIMASRGRMSNSIDQAATQFFTGFEKGIQKLIDSVSNFFNYSSGNFKSLGVLVGYIANELSNIIDTLTTVFVNIDGYLQLLKDNIDELSKDSPVFNQMIEGLKSIGNIAIDWAAMAIAFKLIGSLSGVFLNLASIGGLGKGKSGTSSSEGELRGGLAKGIGTALAGILRKAPLAVAVVSIASGVLNWMKGKGEEYDAPKEGDNAFVAAYKKVDGWFLNHNPTEVGSKATQWVMDYMDNTNKKYMPDKNAVSWDATKVLPSNAQVAMRVSGQQRPQQTDMNIEIVPKGVISLQFPDGSIQKVAMDSIFDFHESQMKSATGSGGSWQSSGDNAGFSPNSLFVKGK